MTASRGRSPEASPPVRRTRLPSAPLVTVLSISSEPLGIDSAWRGPAAATRCRRLACVHTSGLTWTGAPSRSARPKEKHRPASVVSHGNLAVSTLEKAAYAEVLGSVNGDKHALRRWSGCSEETLASTGNNAQPATLRRWLYYCGNQGPAEHLVACPSTSGSVLCGLPVICSLRRGRLGLLAGLPGLGVIRTTRRSALGNRVRENKSSITDCVADTFCKRMRATVWRTLLIRHAWPCSPNYITVCGLRGRLAR
jgi:hypothetical protein